ncbi:MAG: TonB family protein [Chitinivibrionales bacterium]|nr:TonB family protein [Chitinivibrionales bacterium]
MLHTTADSSGCPARPCCPGTNWRNVCIYRKRSSHHLSNRAGTFLPIRRTIKFNWPTTLRSCAAGFHCRQGNAAMKHVRFTYLIFVIFALAAAILRCTRQAAEQPAITTRTDTLSLAEVKSFALDTTRRDGALIRQVARILALAEANKGFVHSSRAGELSRELADQLSLQTGYQPDNEQARRLLAAAAQLHRMFLKTGSLHTAGTLGDSIIAAYIIQPADLPPLAQIKLSEPADSTETPRTLAAFFGRALLLDSTIALLLYEFVIAGEDTAQISDAQSMIKGLLSDGTHGKNIDAPRTRKSVSRKPDLNSKAALKYRTHASIKDTIARHIPNLKAFYKQMLKTSASMSGTVHLNFIVAPSGKVLSVAVKQSSIGERSFLKRLTDYASGIRFLAIPERIGNMSFVYPFEFTPE